MHCKDQLGRSLEIKSIPFKIISLVPSLTELLVDMGLKEKLSGITKFCVHPEKLRTEIPVVGGTKKVHFKKIRQLNPDFILCNKEENTEEMVTELEKIAPVYVSDVITINDCYKLIIELGAILDVNIIAREIVDRISSSVDDFKLHIKNKNWQKVAYLIWKEPFMVAAENTFINSLLQMNHYENVVNSFEDHQNNKRYPEIDLDQIKTADLILLSTEPYPFKDKDVYFFQETLGIRTLKVDGEYFSWYGSRLIKAFAYFKALH